MPKFVSEWEGDDPESRMFMPGFQHAQTQFTMGTRELSLTVESEDQGFRISIGLDSLKWTGSIESLHKALLELQGAG